MTKRQTSTTRTACRPRRGVSRRARPDPKPAAETSTSRMPIACAERRTGRPGMVVGVTGRCYRLAAPLRGRPAQRAQAGQRVTLGPLRSWLPWPRRARPVAPTRSPPPRDHRDRPAHRPPVLELERVTIRFAGDSGDGMQLTGSQFTRTAAVFGNDIATLPDFPAEIRAPAGSLAGVSGFQISFSSSDIHTPGDSPDVLVAMNPAALKTNLGRRARGRRHRRQRGRLHAAEPGQGRLRGEPARRTARSPTSTSSRSRSARSMRGRSRASR